jgi:hypothetical protein
MIDWGRLAKANRRGVSQPRKKAAKAKPKTPRIIHPKIIKPKVTKMSNEKPKSKPEPEKKAIPEVAKKAKSQEPIRQETTKSISVGASPEVLERQKELEAREKTEAKKPNEKKPEEKKK